MGNPANAANIGLAMAAFSSAEAKNWPAWEAAMAGRRDREVREKVWADRLAQLKRACNGRTWAAVIVGAAHATRFDHHCLPCHLDRRHIKFNAPFLAEPPWYKRTR